MGRGIVLRPRADRQCQKCLHRDFEESPKKELRGTSLPGMSFDKTSGTESRRGSQDDAALGKSDSSRARRVDDS